MARDGIRIEADPVLGAFDGERNVTITLIYIRGQLREYHVETDGEGRDVLIMMRDHSVQLVKSGSDPTEYQEPGGQVDVSDEASIRELMAGPTHG